jgi:voltage-gated potassium channel
MLIGIVVFGTCGYYFVEKMPLFEAFYMTIITISTVGYAEIMPLTQAGRALTVIIIILGITVGYNHFRYHGGCLYHRHAGQSVY